jgi:prepilin-type N-terminal cleavage/methylation domain-containing protein
MGQAAFISGELDRYTDDLGFTLIELLVVIAIIAILAVVVVLTLNPAELLRQSRDANRVSDMSTLTDALNLYVTDQAGSASFYLGNASDTYPSTYDPSATSTAGDQCQGLGMLSLNTSTGQAWQCAPSSTYRDVNITGWIPVNLNAISAGSPIGSLPVDPTNQTSSGLFYSYNTNGSQFEVTANLESQKYKAQYGNAPQTPFFPEVISGGTQGVSALYNNSGLVGYWPINEGSGSSTIDQSGSGNNGTWSGASGGSNSTHYTGGKIGSYAGYFDGSTNYVNMGNPTVLQVSQISVFVWTNRSAIVNYARVVANYNSSVGAGAFRLLDSGNGNFQCTSYLSSSVQVGVNTPTGSFKTTGIWQQVGCTYNGSTMTAYINGVAVASTTASGSLYYGAAAPWYIGASYTGTSYQNPFAGSIDDVRIYNRALSAAEIMALYDAER